MYSISVFLCSSICFRCRHLIFSLLNSPEVIFDFANSTASCTESSLFSHIIELCSLYQISLPPTLFIDITGNPVNKYCDEAKHAPSHSENKPPLVTDYNKY